MKRYTAPAASLSRNRSYASVASRTVASQRAMIHRSASVSSSRRTTFLARPASGRVGPSRLLRMNRPAFHSLLAKLRAGANDDSRSSGSRITSVPTDMPDDQRVAQRIGAVALHHLERVDPVAQRLRHLAVLGVAHHAVQVDRVYGASPMNWSPDMIIRATQKKRMSGAETSVWPG